MPRFAMRYPHLKNTACITLPSPVWQALFRVLFRIFHTFLIKEEKNSSQKDVFSYK